MRGVELFLFFRLRDQRPYPPVDGLLKFQEECDNSTVSFLGEIGFKNNRNGSVVIVDSGTGNNND
jgi:hypothetical protein